MEHGGRRGWAEEIGPGLVRQDKTSQTEGGGQEEREKSTKDDGVWGVGEGHPGVGEVYHLSLLCGEAWMDSSCQTSIYRAA